MPGLFHLGWALLLALIALGLLSQKQVAGGWRSMVWQVALAGAVVGWGGWLPGMIARDHGSGLELESVRSTPNSAGAVVLGSDEEHVDEDLRLLDHSSGARNDLSVATGPGNQPSAQ